MIETVTMYVAISFHTDLASLSDGAIASSDESRMRVW